MDKKFRPVPDICMSDVDFIIANHSKVPGKHLENGYKFFFGSYIHKVEVKLIERGCQLRAKCWRSQKKNETPHNLHVTLPSIKAIESQSCGCAVGTGSCAHVATLVYQLAHWKTLKFKTVPPIVSKTSCPQKWHVPSRSHGIVPIPWSEVKFVKPKASRNMQSEQCVCSTLYNPIVSEFPDTDFLNGFKHILPLHGNIQLMQVLPDDFDRVEQKDTPFGRVMVGSSLYHQLPEPKSDGTIISTLDCPYFPRLPLSTHDLTCPYNTVLSENEQLFLQGLSVTPEQTHDIEELEGKQSDYLECTF